MAEQDPSPLLRLPPPRSLRRKKLAPHFPPPPSRVPSQHAQVLQQGVERARQHLEDAERRLPELATDVPYLRVQVAKGAILTDAELRALGLVPVYRREDAVLAAYAVDPSMRRLETQLASYAALKKKLAALAKIESVGAWSREDRTSPRLAAILGHLEPRRQYTIDLLLLPIDGAAANPRTEEAIQAFAERRGGVVVDRADEPNFVALRVRLGGQALGELLEYRDDIALVDLPPAAHAVVSAVLSLQLDDIPEIPEPEATATAICVVDSGIVEGHPLLAPAVLVDRSRSYPPALGPPVPRPPVGDAAHGTHVAGVAVYGDVAASALAKSFSPDFWVINARLLDDKAELHPDRMPFVREIVESASDRARVFNLSYGLEHCAGYLSAHAGELDELTRQHNCLFVVSSGNIDTPALAAGFSARNPKGGYPGYLKEWKWRVRSPGEALNALTVGGLAPDSSPHPANPARQAVAGPRAPSPFSCAGGLKNVVKPELVEIAGDVAYDTGIRSLVDNDPGLRVATTKPPPKLLGFVHGTSFSAPKVAHLAAHVFDRYPAATPNLVRALLVGSARTPEGVQDWKPADAMRVCGFGIPDLDRALYCRPQRVTLFHEGHIDVDEVKLFDIPVPSDLAQSKGRKSITVTIAYDPPVSVVNRERPAGVVLTWRLARGDVPEEQVERAIAETAEEELETSKEEGESEPERRKRVFWPGKMPKRPQQRGTVQKDVFSWVRGEYGDPYRLAVTAKATRPAYKSASQRFAVIVTLECEDPAVQLYTVLRARLAAGRVRVRVPAA